MRNLLFLLLLPLFVWMLIGSYKELKRDYHIESDSDFLFRATWLLGLLFAAVTAFTMAFVDLSLVLSPRRW